MKESKPISFVQFYENLKIELYIFMTVIKMMKPWKKYIECLYEVINF